MLQQRVGKPAIRKPGPALLIRDNEWTTTSEANEWNQRRTDNDEDCQSLRNARVEGRDVKARVQDEAAASVRESSMNFHREHRRSSARSVDLGHSIEQAKVETRRTRRVGRRSSNPVVDAKQGASAMVSTCATNAHRCEC
ncbi:hypothetical protein HN011_005768 [Eciton burchellii]|nr:hypothetical protein HN011_005768 [Eciton burchellii]